VPSGAAAYCAAQQGKGFEMLEEVWDLYARGGPNAFTRTLLFAGAEELGLDIAAFETCFDSDATVAALQTVLDDASAAGVTGTPTVFVNGQRLAFSQSESFFATISRAIDAALASAG
jgi:protein-disulfide isomerase